MPLRAQGMKKSKAFLGGTLSGIVEPIGAAVTILAAGLIVPALPLSAQLCGRGDDLCGCGRTDPGDVCGGHSNIGTLFFGVGFCLMMILDVALG